MRLHCSDVTGDCLPCRSAGDAKTGAEAVRQLVDYRLNLLTGEWWENPEHGNPMLNLLRERLSEANVNAATYALTSYLAETPGVLSLENVQGQIQDRQYTYSATVLTGDGSIEISYEYRF